MAQSWNGAPSSEHSKPVTPGVGESKPTCTLVPTVEPSTGPETIRVDVADNGAGIVPEHISRIFDPFFTTKAPKKGTGLGLSVSYGIVREHGGTIEVDSQPGQGTRFHLEFPVAKPSRASRANGSEPALETAAETETAAPTSH